MKIRFSALFAVLMTLFANPGEKTGIFIACDCFYAADSTVKAVISATDDADLCGLAVCLRNSPGAEFIQAENLSRSDMTVIPGADMLIITWSGAENTVRGELAEIFYHIPPDISDQTFFYLSAPPGACACREIDGKFIDLPVVFPENPIKARRFQPSEPFFVGCQETKPSPDGSFTVRCWFACGENADMSQIEVSCDGNTASTPTESTYILSGKDVFTADFFGCEALFFADIVVFADAISEISVNTGKCTHLLRYKDGFFIEIIG